jgi:hypothetical protein
MERNGTALPYFFTTGYRMATRSKTSRNAARELSTIRALQEPNGARVTGGRPEATERSNTQVRSVYFVVKLLLRNTNLNITKKRQRYYTESL